MFKVTLFIRTKAQHAICRGNPLYHATKRHLNNNETVKNDFLIIVFKYSLKCCSHKSDEAVYIFYTKKVFLDTGELKNKNKINKKRNRQYKSYVCGLE